MIETEAAPTAQPYSPSVLDLIKVSTEVCHTLEHVRELSREELVRRMLVMLPMVYLKVQLIGNVDSQPGWRQQRLTEDDYNYIREGVSAVMAERDDYLDVFVQDFRYSDAPVLQTISENLADIYQALRELVESFREGDEEEMRLALYEAFEDFKLSWGQTLLNALRALHDATYGGREAE